MSDSIDVKIDNSLEDEFPILKLTKEQRSELFISSYDRGMVGARLVVDVPPGIHYEWCSADPIQVARLEGLGFKKGTKYFNHALNTKGTGDPIIGDVMLMVCPQEVKDEIDKARRMRYLRDNQTGVNKAKEDIEGKALLESVGPSEYVPVMDLRSKLINVTLDEAQS